MFDVGIGEMAVLLVLALVIFGDKLPSVAAQAGRALRQLRTMANSAKQDLREGLGPEFADFDPMDLNPKNFVRKHLFDDLDESGTGVGAASALGVGSESAYASPALSYGERPPFDNEAT